MWIKVTENKYYNTSQFISAEIRSSEPPQNPNHSVVATLPSMEEIIIDEFSRPGDAQSLLSKIH
jgi:hypothetical protein